MQRKADQGRTFQHEDTKPMHPQLDFDNFHELIPQLSFAYSQGAYTPRSTYSLEFLPGMNRFTHFVKVVAATKHRKAGDIAIEVDQTTQAHSLFLSVHIRHSRKRRTRSGRHVRILPRNHTILTHQQLIAARQFISMALPYPERLESGSHALVTAPKADGTIADIMSIVVCYLSCASSMPVAEVSNEVDEDMQLRDHGWRSAIGEDGIDIVKQCVEGEWVG
ncbi:hypothetical protein FA15DRAFT_644892 [Coprinopsis marcescibilis]|uniref:Uncharacterized protein n=1 Tax=Coprinopsis marcescibilis TaxID=230819 RepID=A0A5C3L163_COPMA|nr:hypothetical protein FA15DRAFT_644892 [Coprinopsis marcescibilis]